MTSLLKNESDAFNPADLYNAEYYQNHLGPIPYSRESSQFLQFFAQIADQLIRSLQPETVLDAGCALGFLVEAFWDRGVKAWGIDVSPYAISRVRADIRAYCQVGSVADAISGRYDLVTCIEVLEHVPEPQALEAIRHLAAVTDTILFSSSPTDFLEHTHVNVHQPIWWLERFQEVGFAPDLTFDASFISAQAMLLRRREQAFDFRVLSLFSEWLRVKHKVQLSEATFAKNRSELSEAEERYRACEARVAERETEIAGLSATLERVTAELRSERMLDATERAREAATITAALRQVTNELELERAAAARREEESERLVSRLRDMSTALGERESKILVLRQLEAQLLIRTQELQAMTLKLNNATARLNQVEQDVAAFKTQANAQAAFKTTERALIFEEEKARMQSHLTERIGLLEVEQRKLVGEIHQTRGAVAELQAVVEKSEQRIAIFVHQIEQSAQQDQRLRDYITEETAKLDQERSSLRAVSTRLDKQYTQLSSGLAEALLRIDDLNSRCSEMVRTQARQDQQIVSVAGQVQGILTSRIWQTLVKSGGFLLKMRRER